MHAGDLDRPPVGDHLLPQGLGEPADGELRGVVGGLARHPHQPEEAGDVHDVSVTGLDEMRQERLRAMHDAPEVDVHHPLEVVVVDLLVAAEQRHARVVDHDVHPTEPAADRVGVVVHGPAVADVHTLHQDPPAGAGPHQPGGLGQSGLVRVTQGEDRTPGGGVHGKRPADAGARSGDRDDLVVERPHEAFRAT